MPISFCCPQCRTHLQAPDERAGLPGSCYNCGATIDVPLADHVECQVAGSPAEMPGAILPTPSVPAVRFARPTANQRTYPAWAVVIGVLSILIGMLGLMGALADQIEGWGTVFLIAGLAVTILLLVGAIALLCRCRWAARALVVWAVLRILFAACLIGTMVFVMPEEAKQVLEDIQAEDPSITKEMRSVIYYVTLGMLLVWYWAWPVFTLCWFSRRKIREEMADWSTAKDSPVAAETASQAAHSVAAALPESVAPPSIQTSASAPPVAPSGDPMPRWQRDHQGQYHRHVSEAADAGTGGTCAPPPPAAMAQSEQGNAEDAVRSNFLRPFGDPICLYGPVAPTVMLAVVAFLVLWGLFGIINAAPEATVSIPSPFLTAAVVVVVPYLLWYFLWHVRRRGIRLDETGLFDLGTRVQIRWADISEVWFATAPSKGLDKTEIPYAVVKSTQGDAIRFTDASEMPGDLATEHGKAKAIAHASLMLAVIADRRGAAALFPPQWQRGAQAAVDGESDDHDHVVAEQTLGDKASKRGPLAVLLFKVLPKFGKLLSVGLKTVKLGPAALAFGSYAVIFSWQFALLFLLMIGIHECGHVYAMWRCGVKVKGIYLIPFMGGAAVAEGQAKTRWANSFIDICGPIYGTVLALLFLAAFYLTGEQYAILAAGAGWGALVNLFNLLPIMPLDGGRILGEVTHSVHHVVGRLAVLGSLAAGIVLAYMLGLGLLWFVVGVGMFEFAISMRAATQRALGRRLSGDHPYTLGVHEYFRVLLRPSNKPLSDKDRRRLRDEFNGLQLEADLVPMTTGQTVIVVAGYFALAMFLVLLAWLVSHVPGADEAWNVLR